MPPEPMASSPPSQPQAQKSPPSTSPPSLPPPNTHPTTTLSLPSTRTLSFTPYGPPTSPHPPILFFHGAPSSRLEGLEWSAAAHTTSTQLIALDRWGHGLSSPFPGARLTDWAADVLEVVKHLGLLKKGKGRGFYILGSSGGGPYALACAHSLPSDVGLLGTGVLGGVAPPAAGVGGMALDRMFAVLLNRYVPLGVMTSILNLAAGNAARSSDEVWANHAEKLLPTLSEEEREFYNDPQHKKEKDALLECYREAFRQGGRGPAEDAKRVLSEWGFELGDVRRRIRLWHGGGDVNVPVRTARWMQERLPDAELKVYEGETHFRVPENHAEEILRELVGMGREGEED